MPPNPPQSGSNPSKIGHNRDLQFSTLNQVSAVISQSGSLKKALNNTLDQILSLTRAEVGTIHILEEKGEEFRLAAWRGVSDSFRAHEDCIPMKECLCGEAAFKGEILSSSDLENDSRVSRGGCREERFGSIVSIPLKSINRVVGIFTIYSTRRGAFEQRDEDLLGLVGAQIGVAVENAMLYARMRNMAVEEERGNIAKEIHDGVAQSLAFLNLQTRQLDDFLKKNKREEAVSHLGEIRQVIKDTYEDVRELLVDFRLKFKSGLGFSEALSSYAEGFRQRTGIQVHLVDETGALALSPDSQAQVFRVVQESLSNIRKHSRADEVRLSLKTTPTHFEVHVRDNGCGFDPGEVPGGNHPHMGLEIMKERVAQIKGGLSIQSSPGDGTTLQIRVPLIPESE